MFRQLHKIPGLFAALLIVVVAASGVVLSLVPALDTLSAPPAPAAQMNVAELAASVQRHLPGLANLSRQPSGKIIAAYSTDTAQGQDVIDPRTGAVVGPYTTSAFVRWMTSLHRSLFLRTEGRIAVGLSALAMVLLCVSGAVLLARRMGGWRKVFGPARGSLSHRLHIELGRFAIMGLMLSGVTGLWMSMANFNLLPNAMGAMPQFPASVNGGKPAPIGTLQALQAIPVSDLRNLTFPTDPSDVFTVTTAGGMGYIDQATGKMLSYQANGVWKKIYEWIYMLHTGEGFWSLGLILGLASLCSLVLSWTGTILWWRRRQSLPKMKHNHIAHTADTIILVGSDGGATWGFARTLHDALTASGYKCHTASMNQLARHYAHAQQMFILTSTHGDGAAPESARNFMARLEKFHGTPKFPVALLGFGDRQFPKFSQFGHDVAAALDARKWYAMLPYHAIDRQSVQDFARWGRTVGEALGHALELTHQPVRPRTRRLELVERIDYGHEVQAPTTVFRFLAPDVPPTFWERVTGRAALPRFEAGDLVGILPPGSDLPRFYSLATSSRDGFLEICVRKHPGGECSGYLHSLEPGETVECFIKQNPDFRPVKGRAPIILIGAGTGIGPLAGFIRANARGRAMHLYFGGRDPKSDFLYAEEIESWLTERRLTSLTTAFSRISDRAYVQDRIVEDAHRLRTMIERGAQIMVCGGRDMAEGVMQAVEEALAPVGLSVVKLKAEGRYLEDVY
ncbi:MAG: PepSY domain-containing protein [Paracoccaceae bacterium]|nr:PepSY domain-containing protein [Paracoccaceae bacterium]